MRSFSIPIIRVWFLCLQEVGPSKRIATQGSQDVLHQDIFGIYQPGVARVWQ